MGQKSLRDYLYHLHVFHLEEAHKQEQRPPALQYAEGRTAQRCPRGRGIEQVVQGRVTPACGCLPLGQ